MHAILHVILFDGVAAGSDNKVVEPEVTMPKRTAKKTISRRDKMFYRITGPGKRSAVSGGVSASTISVRGIRQKFGVSQEELARVTGYSTRSVAGWESGQLVSDSAHQKLIETERLRSALAQIIPASEMGEWLRTPNAAFEGQTPIQIIERGESDRIWQMIFQVDANVAS